MTVLVTGAAGFIGSHVARSLLARGEKVVGVDNFSEYYDPILKFARLKPLRDDRAFTFIEGDVANRDTMLGLAMWLGRFGVIVPVLAIAGALASKKRLPVTSGTLPTHGPLFVVLLIGTVLLVGLLNYVPALALGPIVEHLLLWPAQ